MAKHTITLEVEQWRAIAAAAKLGILAHDMLGPDEETWDLGKKTVEDADAALRQVDEHARTLILGDRENLPPVSIEPERFPREQAVTEGWFIDIDEAANEWVVCALEDGPFKSHAAALAHVQKLAGRSQYHEDALGWIDRGNLLLSAAQVKSCIQIEGLVTELAVPETAPWPDMPPPSAPPAKRGLFARMFGG